MSERILCSVVSVIGLVGILCAPCMALKVAPDRAKIEAQAKSIESMAAVGDIDGLVCMLSDGEFPSQEAAAEHLREIGDERALAELIRLNTAHGGWVIGFLDDDRSGAFAVAICRILTRGFTEGEKVEALLDLLDGRGPAVPEALEPHKIRMNGTLRNVPHRLDRNRWVGERLAVELDEFEDPSITARLRHSENEGISPYAVWREVRDMKVEDAIARCSQIARDEGGAQRYGAIHCLGHFGSDGVAALNQLAHEGHAEAIAVLGQRKEDPKIFELLCRHATSTRNCWARSRAVDAISYVQTPSYEVQSLTVLVEALYDPSDTIRRKAATALLNRAYPHNKVHFQKIEDSLLVALRHPDTEVSSRIRGALERLGCERLDAAVSDPPAIRTDLETRSLLPTTAQQRLKAETDPLEKEATNALRFGPAEKAVTLYERLLKLKPGFEQYEHSLDTARAYVAAARATTIPWRADTPYAGLKGRHSYLLARTHCDATHLKEVFALEADLTRLSGGWVFQSKNIPDMGDLRVKYLTLLEHVIEHYPANESLALRAKMESAILRKMLYKDTMTYVLRLIDVFSIRAEEITSSMDAERNPPPIEYKGKTGAAAAHEVRKEQYRRSVISSCMADPQRHYFLDVIIARCADSDPEIVEMARSAKIEIAEGPQTNLEVRTGQPVRRQNELH